MINKARLLNGLFRPFTAGLAFFVLCVSAAHAQSVGNVIVRMDTSTNAMPNFFELLAYISGLFALFSGVIALRDSSQKPGEKPLRPAIIRFIIAAMLIALPRTVATVTTSFGANPNAPSKIERPRLMKAPGFD
jgi:hypothetical protein